MTTARDCPACGGRAATSVGDVNRHRLVRCCSCRTVYAPEPVLGHAEDEYEGYYTESNLHAPAFIGLSLDRTVAGFAPYRRCNRLLDVGFGGAFAMQAAARAGWDVEGVEVSKPAVDHARSLGLDAHHGELQKAGLPTGHFDVVILSEVLEHVVSPQEVLEEAARILRPGGLLWATTPHCDGISARVIGLRWTVLDPPEHMHLFSRRGLRTLLLSTGFQPQRMVTENVNPIEIVRHLKSWGSNGAADAAAAAGTPDEFDRVQAGYGVLEKIYARPTLRFAKERVDDLLHLTRMGDTIRVWATAGRGA